MSFCIKRAQCRNDSSDGLLNYATWKKTFPVEQKTKCTHIANNEFSTNKHHQIHVDSGPQFATQSANHIPHVYQSILICLNNRPANRLNQWNIYNPTAPHHKHLPCLFALRYDVPMMVFVRCFAICLVWLRWFGRVEHKISAQLLNGE